MSVIRGHVMKDAPRHENLFEEEHYDPIHMAILNPYGNPHDAMDRLQILRRITAATNAAGRYLHRSTLPPDVISSIQRMSVVGGPKTQGVVMGKLERERQLRSSKRQRLR